jgi:hypothetical protein
VWQENDCRTSFWEDALCGHSPLKDKFPEIYEICNEKNITVTAAFRRWLYVDLQEQWCGLVNILNQGVLNESVDRPRWKWTKDDQFTVKRLYK